MKYQLIKGLRQKGMLLMDAYKTNSYMLLLYIVLILINIPVIGLQMVKCVVVLVLSF